MIGITQTQPQPKHEPWNAREALSRVKEPGFSSFVKTNHVCYTHFNFINFCSVWKQWAVSWIKRGLSCLCHFPVSFLPLFSRADAAFQQREALSRYKRCKAHLGQLWLLQRAYSSRLYEQERRLCVPFFPPWVQPLRWHRGRPTPAVDQTCCSLRKWRAKTTQGWKKKTPLHVFFFPEKKKNPYFILGLNINQK